jgi:bacillithiol biosynthesis cysteine-adding enzyme BshC
MDKKVYSFAEFGASSQIVRDLIAEETKTKIFINQFYSIKAILEQVKQKEFSSASRENLVERLTAQNANLKISEKTAENIAALKNENTFTITTGHQLNLMTGPLYTIYKIAQTIAIAEQANSAFESGAIVPVFWMATEDHDFEEINHIHLFGKKISWDKNGQEDAIVGAVKLEGIEGFISEIEEKYKDETLRAALQEFTKSYRESSNLADATRQLINQLFGEFGLIILDGNDAALKKEFAPIVRKEIEEQFTFKAVNTTNQVLTDAGYHHQVYLRESNLFYIDEDNKRNRIVFENGSFHFLEREWSRAELLKEVDRCPERFSPNALLRPVYQETILPNLVYVGGGGEIAYWMQLKGVFDALSLAFPILRVRDSFLLMQHSAIEQLDQLNLSVLDLRDNLHVLLKEMALSNNDENLELHHEKEVLKKLGKRIEEKTANINKGLVAMVGAEFARMEKSLEKIESSLIKSEKSKLDKEKKQLESLKEKCFPNGSFQERYDNFIPQILKNPNFVKNMVSMFPGENEPKVRILEI